MDIRNLAQLFMWVVSIGVCTGAVLFDCSGSLVYTKLTGVTPDLAMLALLYNNSRPGITKECFSRCSNSSNSCTDFIVDYDVSACFRADTSPPDYNLTFQGDAFLQTYLEVMTSRNINFFQQTCLRVPASCSGKLWVVELVEGYELIGYSTTVFNVTSYEECAELCLNDARLPCLSASFYADVDGSGTCALSPEDRRTRPGAFRPSINDVIYIENQCSLPKGNSCSFEEYANSSLISYADVYLTNMTRSQCEDRCTNEKSFQCRGFTFTPASLVSYETSECSLHGDDSFSLGPGAIEARAGAVYLERVPCLDLVVTCNTSLLNVTLRTGEPFSGRIFVNGYSNTCSSDGRGLNVTSLILPLAAGNASQQCGVKVARSIGETVRTLASALVVVQFNMILQRRGDRALRVGCAMEEGPPKNVTLGAGIMFPGDVDLELGLGSVVVNSSSSLPTVRIRLVDATSGLLVNTNLTHLGDLLQLRIDLEQPNGTYNIMATHLVATTGDNSQSYLLVDGRGCPPDPATFPGFRRDPNTGSLFADFRAFKFPGSTVVRFNVMVQFCPGACQTVFCPNGASPSGRRRRTVADTPAGGAASGGFPATVPPRELPLELAITVLGPKDPNDPRLLTQTVPGNETTFLLATLSYDALVCVSYASFLAIILGWLAIQVVLLIASFFLVRWWMKREERVIERKLDEDFNTFENRRVHWADTNPHS